LEAYRGERGVSCVLWKERRRRKVWKIDYFLCVKRCCSWKEKYVQIRAWKEVVCSKYLKWSS
jgi:hypothetical protein